jgi:peptide/nickel transport system permease protein
MPGPTSMTPPASHSASTSRSGSNSPIYVGKVFTGDLGRSVLTSNTVVDDIKRVFPATLELATLGTLIGCALGIPLGVLAAVYQGRWPDQIARVVGLFGYSIPIFWIGLMALLLFYAKLGWVGGPAASASPIRISSPRHRRHHDRRGAGGRVGGVRDAWSHLILPSSVLACSAWPISAAWRAAS